MRIPSGLAVAAILGSVVGMTGCGVGPVERGTTPGAAAMNGRVHGGQQPVSGAQVYLYAVATTGNGDAATPLLVSPGYVTTDANGNFNFTGAYSCPAGSYVYLLALGGNPGLAANTNNPELALAAGLGACSTLTPTSFFTVNEVTTAAAAYSFAAMASSDVQVGSSNAATITNAFSNITNLTDITHGNALVATPAGNGSVPQAKIDSLANALAACINSDGTGTPCSTLMSAANVTGAGGTPVDTFQAALNIAHSPTANVGAIYGLATPSAVFQPTLTSAPPDWTITIQYPTSATVSLSPASATIGQTAQQGLTASVSGATAGSYQWTTTAAAGLLTEVGGAGRVGQTSYCSTSAQANYVPNASPALTGHTSDAVSLRAFSGAGCLSANLLASISANVAIIPPANSTSLSGFPTTTYTGTVVLPSGSQIRPDSLTVVDSLTSTTPSASGTFTLPRYDDGEQIAVVLSPNGNAMMMGWMDAAHPTISPSTTAEVLAYFALGGMQMLNESDRSELISKIPQLGSFPALAQVVATELGNNPDAFAQTDPNLHAGLNTFFTSITGITPQVAMGGTGVKTHDVVVIPDSGNSPQSGVDVVAQAPDSAYMTNDYRRRTHAFVTRVSDTLAGQDTADAAAIANFEIPPTVGVSGGVTGAVNDIFNAYFGNQPTAYATQTTDPFGIPLTNGFTSTTYKVVNLGPGGKGILQIGTLTPAQGTALVQVSVAGFVSDALVPFLSNFAFGSGFLPDAATTPVTGVTQFKANFVTDLQNDFLSFLPSLPGEQDKIVAGDYKGVLTDLFTNAANTSTVRNLFDGAAQRASALYSSYQLDPGALATGMKSFNVILNAAGGVLQLFDSAVYNQQLKGADVIDTWTLKTTKTTVTLSPLTTTLNGPGNVQFTAAVPSVGDTTGYSFHWKLTPAAGQQLVGSFPSYQGTGSATDFCSSSADAVYVNTSAAVAALTAPGTDTVTVTAFNAAGCAAAKELGAASATVTTNPNGVRLSPASSFISQTAQQGLTATIPGTSNTTGFSYQWVVRGTSGNPPVGRLNEIGGIGQVNQTSYCSTSAQANYVPNASPLLTQNATDTVTVQAFTSSGCAPAANSVGTSAPSSITVTAVTLLLTPRNTTITQTQQQTLLVQPTGATTGLSYQWSTSGTAGLLNEVGGAGQTNRTSYCSTSAQSTYIPNPTPTVTSPVVDTVTVQAFTDPACTAASAASGPVLTSVTVAVAATFLEKVLADVPNLPQADLIEARDGNFYATTTYGGVNGQGSIFKMTKGGVVTTLHSFNGADGSTPYSGVIEGWDGNFYGMTFYGGSNNTGTVFQMTPQGVLTTLYSFTNGTDGSYPIGALVQGNDGNFYGTTTGGGDLTIYSPSGVFFQITPTGAYKVLTTFTGAQRGLVAYMAGTMLQGADGNFYGSSNGGGTSYNGTIFEISPGGVPTLLWSFSNGPDGSGPHFASLVQGPDGSFYGVTSVNGQYAAPDTLGVVYKIPANGPLSEIHSFHPGGDPSDGYYPVSGLQWGSDGFLYGTAYEGASTACAHGCGTFYKVSPDGSSFATIYHFGTTPDAGSPYTSIPLQASDGNFYGLTVKGGSANQGAAYEIEPSATILPAPIQLTFSANPAPAGQPLTLTWNVLNAFSTTAQQCVASVQGSPAGAGAWSGLQTGVTTGTVYGGSASITPTIAGTYIYALTCGGKQSGFGTLVVQ